MTATLTAPGEPADAMPIWARLQLITLGVPFRRVTHFIPSRDGNRIGAAVDGEPVFLIRKER